MQGLLSKVMKASCPYSRRLQWNVNLNLYSRCDRQSTCANVAREILEELKQNVDLYQSEIDRETFSSNFRNFKVFCILDDKCHPDARYLSVHKCNVLAKACLDEAIFQLMDDTVDVSDKKNKIISILEAYIVCLMTSPFSSNTCSSSLDASLSVYKLKFMGKGMQYLEKISQNKFHNRNFR